MEIKILLDDKSVTIPSARKINIDCYPNLAIHREWVWNATQKRAVRHVNNMWVVTEMLTGRVLFKYDSKWTQKDIISDLPIKLKGKNITPEKFAAKVAERQKIEDISTELTN